MIKKINNKSVRKLIEATINEVKAANIPAEIPKLEKLVSAGSYFKIKKTPYRFGLYIKNDTVEFVKFGTRESFYRDFPPY